MDVRPVSPTVRRATAWVLALSALAAQFSPLRAADPKPVYLWPDGAPGSKGDEADDRPAIWIHRAPSENNTGAAVIICPGGGYGGVMMSYEGHEVAEWFTSIGVSGIVLRYRHAPKYAYPRPQQDAHRAVAYVRSKASQLGIDPQRIGLMGFSAGGHLAASTATVARPEPAEGDDPLRAVSSRPDFLVLAYPVITLTDPHTHSGSRQNLLGATPSAELVKALSCELQVTKETPPTFLFHTASDRAVPEENSLMFYRALREHDVEAELHIYRKAPHGVGLNRNPSIKSWPRLLRNWMRFQGLLESKKPSPAVGSEVETRKGRESTPVARMKVAEGFRVERVYSVPKSEQGSWVNITPDPQGRLIVSDQNGALYRVTPPALGAQSEAEVERIPLDIGGAHGLLCAFDSLYVVRNESGTHGLYRVRDTDGDDQYDQVELLRELHGGGEHGPHAVVTSPDGRSLFVLGGNHTKLPEPETSRVPRVWDEDQLLGRHWDASGHARGVLAPGGWIAETDPEGKSWELWSNGFRNQFDMAFDASGELFTYDADMEWDVGTAWYRPTRINHVTSGSEFGWRSGTGKWPTYYPDSLPEVVDVGPGSPTGICFGYGAKFPAKYQQALYICDWSYGKLYAVHLKPDGATYTGELEQIVAASPLPVSDVIVNPADGAMYFTIGGRRTQSGLYRLTAEKPEPAVDWRAKAATQAPAPEVAIRRALEELHGGPVAGAVDRAWKFLGHRDRHVRYAARIAIEHQPVAEWQERVLSEENPIALIEGAIALARHGAKGLQGGLLDALLRLPFERLPEMQKLAALRAWSLTCIRMGRPDKSAAQRLVDKLDGQFPASSQSLNRELAQLLIYLGAEGATQRTVAILKKAPTQEEQIAYAFSLRNVREGWRLEDRRAYFDWLNDARGFYGGHSFNGFLKNIKKDALAALDDGARKALGDSIADRAPRESFAQLPEPDGPGKAWTLDELLGLVEKGLEKRSFAEGKKMFSAARCFQCHRFGGEGGSTGPDLTSLAGRFSVREVIESLVDPNAVVSDQYEATTFVLKNGTVVTGRIVNMSGDNWNVNTDMTKPGQSTRVNRNAVLQILPSKTSMMPAALLNPLNREEVLNLLAYLLSRGDATGEMFE